MYVPPATQPAPALAPVGVVTTETPAFGAPVDTALKVTRARLNVLESHRATVTGTLLEGHHAGQAGLLVSLQALGRHGWRTLESSRTRAHGRFQISLLARRLGSRVVRLRFRGGPLQHSSHRRLGRLSVYRLAEASWYGGGGGLACGGELTSSTLGVANKTLPCGTIVTLHYDGHTVRVPVVDRGPYVAGREYDLTEATKRELGFGDLGEVWATS
jgi:rare lipoprotein A